jgi:c-di-GMP-binding flagellar brake protein YcgR
MSLKTTDSDLGTLTDLLEAKPILKVNSLITIQHSRIFAPQVASVQKIEGANIFFALPRVFIQNGVLVGDKLTCSFFHDDTQYVINGTIGSIELIYPRLVCLVAGSTRKYKNNRQFKRYYVSFPTHVTIPDTHTDIFTIITNISMRGAAAVFKEPLTNESIKFQALVKMTLPEKSDEFLEFKAKIVRTATTDILHEYGVEIVEIDAKNEQILKNIITRLEKNEGMFAD